MRKLLIGLLLIAPACTTRTTTVTPAPTSVGSSAAPRAALDSFLAAIRAKDLQALGAVWGDKNGAIRDRKSITREEVEQRELVLMCYFTHDTYKVLSDSPAPDAERKMSVTLTRGTISRTTNFYLANGGERWYVRSADMEPVRDLCKKR